MCDACAACVTCMKRVCWLLHATAHIWRSEDNSVEPLLPVCESQGLNSGISGSEAVFVCWAVSPASAPFTPPLIFFSLQNSSFTGHEVV